MFFKHKGEFSCDRTDLQWVCLRIPGLRDRRLSFSSLGEGGHSRFVQSCHCSFQGQGLALSAHSDKAVTGHQLSWPGRLPGKSERFQCAADTSGASGLCWKGQCSWAGCLGAEACMKRAGCSCRERASECEAGENKESESPDLSKMASPD